MGQEIINGGARARGRGYEGEDEEKQEENPRYKKRRQENKVAEVTKGHDSSIYNPTPVAVRKGGGRSAQNVAKS